MRTEGVVKDLDVRDLVSDAGSMLVGATEFRGGVVDVSMRLQEPLEEDDLGESSAFRELQALEMALPARGESLRSQSVRWVGDLQSDITILMVGSMKPRCHAVTVQIWDLAHKFNIRLSYTWMTCTSAEIQVTDYLSKNFDSSEYKISPDDFSMLCQRFDPFCLDLFASPLSHLFKPYCSRFLCKDTAAVDAFTVDWSSMTNGFFHPPVGLISRVLKHAQYVKAKGVLIVPVRESADFLPVIICLVGTDHLIKLSLFCPYMVAAQSIVSSVFKGKSDFDFMDFRFRF